MIIGKYFTRISLYIKEYSILQILTKIKSKILSQIGLRVSKTIFLKLNTRDEIPHYEAKPKLIEIDFYDNSLKSDFGKINVYKFLDIDIIQQDKKKKLIVAKNKQG